MRLLEGLAELIAPTRCAGCERPGALLCEPCTHTMPSIDPTGACPSCGAPFGHLICTECWRTEYAFEAAVCLGELDGALARAIVLHKDAGEQRLGGLLGGLLGEVVAARWPTWADAVTWVPATDAAVRRRGFDHAAAVAGGVARVAGLRCAPLLGRHRARDQRLLGRLQRAANSKGTFFLKGDVPPRVLVVDDVMTTGATLDAAAAALLEGGACAVRAAVVARCW